MSVVSSVEISQLYGDSVVQSDPIAVQAGDVVVVSLGTTYAPGSIAASDDVHGSYGAPVATTWSEEVADYSAIWCQTVASSGTLRVTVTASGDLYGSICEATVLRDVDPTPAGATSGDGSTSPIGPVTISGLPSGDYLIIGLAEIANGSSPSITPDGSQTSIRTGQMYGTDAGNISYREQNGVTSASLTWTGTNINWYSYAAVAFAAGAGSAVEGDLDVTLGAATTSASGTLAIAGAAAVSLGAATVSATAALPITGSASLTPAAASLSASGAVSTAPIITSVIGDPGGLGIVTRGGLVTLTGINL